MAVFRYTAIDKQREDHSESGTVLALDEAEARQKLVRLNLQVVRIKRMSRVAGFLKSFTPDVR